MTLFEDGIRELVLMNGTSTILVLKILCSFYV
jgi:hypothetical protein